jgi:hypothetical protein
LYCQPLSYSGTLHDFALAELFLGDYSVSKGTFLSQTVENTLYIGHNIQLVRKIVNISVAVSAQSA